MSAPSGPEPHPEESADAPPDPTASTARAAQPAPPAARSPRERPTRHWFRARHEVVWLVLLAALVRALAALVNPALPRDAVGLLDAARAVTENGPGVVLGLPVHPLPPLVIAWLSRVLDAELAGTGLSVLLGALAVWPLHALARRAVGRHAAGAACLLYIGLPKAVNVASVPLTEALLLPAFLSALAFAAWACQGPARCGRRAALAGLLAGVAYLVRPEGLVAAFAAGSVLLIASGRRLRRTVSFALVFLVVATPYVALLSNDRGRLSLSPKKDVVRFVGADSSRPDRSAVPVPSNTVEEPTPLDAFSGTLSGLESALTVPVLLLILAGILTPRRWRHRRPRRGRGLLVATAGVLVALVVRLQLGWGYGGGRHLLVAGTLLLPFGGAGLFVLAGWFPGVRSRRRFAFFAALILMIPLGLRAVLRPPGQGGVAARQLGREVATAAAADDDLVIASVAEPRVAYYARRTAGPGARVRDLPLWGPFVRPLELGADVDQVVARLVDAVREEHVDWVVLDLWRERASGPGPEFPQRVLYEELLARGVIERRALGAGSGLAAFRVVRGIRER